MAETSSLRFPVLESPINDQVYSGAGKQEHAIKNAERQCHFNGVFEREE